MVPQVDRRLAAILSADAVGFSRLMADDEADTIRVVTAFRKSIADLVTEHRGRVVDSPGDNVLAEFTTALDAMTCAVECQRVLAARNEGLVEGRRMVFRMGIHLGDISVQEDRLYGDGVNIAARLEGLAEPGGICVSSDVHGQVAGKVDVAFSDLGEQSLKNIPKPVRVYRARVDARRAKSRPSGHNGRPARPIALAAVLLVAALSAYTVWSVLESRPQVTRAPARFNLKILGEGRLADRSFPPVALAPDGQTAAYVAASGKTSRLFLRPLDQLVATTVPGTEGAVSPFFSPNGDWVGFFANGALLKVPTTGGAPVVVCEIASVDRPTAHWGAGGEIIFSRGVNSSDGLLRVSESGGVPERLTMPDVEAGESWHGLPQKLPGGEVLFTVATADGYRAALLSPKSGEWETLDWLGPAAAARYLTSGHLIFGQPARLMAVAWTVGTRTGTPILVLEGVNTSRLGVPEFSASENGSLLYVPGQAVKTTPVLVDREGNATSFTDDPGAFQHPRLSPDGLRLAVDIMWQGTSHIYIYDLERGTRRRLTHRGFNIDPLWTPDGKRIFFRSNRPGSEAEAVYWISADGSGQVENLLQTLPNMVPGSWRSGGELLVLTNISAARETRELWVANVTEAGAPELLLTSQHNVGWGVFSPDGRWLAYVSDETGGDEVWVRSSEGAGPAEQVSRRGGIEPVWAPSGAELFYRNGDELLAVTIETEPRLRPGATQTLFRGRYDLSPSGHQHYDVHPRGDRFAMIRLADETDSNEIHLVLGWDGELGRRVPTRD